MFSTIVVQYKESLSCFGSEASCFVASFRVPPLVVQESQKGISSVQQGYELVLFIARVQSKWSTTCEGGMEEHATIHG